MNFFHYVPDNEIEGGVLGWTTSYTLKNLSIYSYGKTLTSGNKVFTIMWVPAFLYVWFGTGDAPVHPFILDLHT